MYATYGKIHMTNSAHQAHNRWFRTAITGRPAQLCEKDGKSRSTIFFKRIKEGKQKEKVEIKRHIRSTLKFVAFLNSQRFEVCSFL